MLKKFNLLIILLFFIIVGNSQSLFDSIGQNPTNKPLPNDKISMVFSYCENELYTYPEKVYATLNDAKKYLDSNKIINRQGELYYHLANYYYLSENFDSAEYCYKKTISEFKITDNKPTIKSLINLSAISANKEDMANAKKYLNRANSIAGKTDKPVYIGLVYQQQANIFMIEELYPEASSFFQKAINQYQITNDTLKIASVYANIAQIYTTIGNHPLAIDYLEKAEKLFLELGNLRNSAINEIQMGVVFLNSGKYYDALKNLTKAEAYFIMANDTRNLAKVYNQKGKTYEKLRQYNNSDDYLNKSLVIKKHYNDIIGQSKVLANMGDLYTAMGRIKKAQNFYIKSLKLIETTDNKNIKLNLYTKLSNNYSALNDYKKAYKYQIRFYALDHDLVIQKNKALLTRLENQYEEKIAGIENEKKILQKELSIFTDSKKQKVKFFKIIILLLFIVLLTLILIIAKRKKQNANSIKKLQDTINGVQTILEKSNIKYEKLKKSSDRIFKITTKNMWEPYLVLERLANQISSETTANKVSKNRIIFDNDQLIMALNLLDNVQFWAKNQLKMIELHPEPIQINDLIKTTIRIQKLRATAKNIIINYRFDSVINVYADKNTIGFALRNLIENAIKFSTINSEISIVVIDKSNFVEIKIIDSGVGMTKDQINTLFSVEKQYMAAGISGETGGGLGLALSKEFIERNFGTFRIKSSIALGTTVSIVLPSTSDNLWHK